MARRRTKLPTWSLANIATPVEWPMVTTSVATGRGAGAYARGRTRRPKPAAPSPWLTAAGKPRTKRVPKHDRDRYLDDPEYRRRVQQDPRRASILEWNATARDKARRRRSHAHLRAHGLL